MSKQRKPLTDEQRARKRAASRAWYASNKEAKKSYYKKNKKRIKEAARNWRAENRDRYLKQQSKYNATRHKND